MKRDQIGDRCTQNSGFSNETEGTYYALEKIGMVK
jgi:hypothetical protein